MYALKIETGRYFASFGTIRQRRYTDNLCNYWTSANKSYAKKKAQALADIIGRSVIVTNLDANDTLIVRPCC